MNIPGYPHPWKALLTRGKRRWLLLFPLLAGSAGLISCVSVNRTVLAPPEIPGATYAGSKSCSECHENITKHFDTATHARVLNREKDGNVIGCESCHGPGSLHTESGGGRHTIINPKKSPETCFQCHLEVRAKFNLASHHPLDARKVSCTDCHDPHRGPAIISGGTSLASANETCFKCHTAQRGPFVFEHEALREGCTTCHSPHGSVNQRMLTDRNQQLCLKCHLQQQTGGGFLIGGRNHIPFLSRGACWTAGCHEAVHGSQVNTSLRF